MKPSKIVIEVTSEGEIILLKDSEGRTVEYSVDVLTTEEAKEAISTPTSTAISPTEITPHDRHFVLANDLQKERKHSIEKYLSPTTYVMSFPSRPSYSTTFFPTDCAWFFNLQDKPDRHSLRCNLSYAECTTVAKIFHHREDLAFTDDFFRDKIGNLWEVCKGDDQRGSTYPGIIHNPEHLKALEKLPYLLEDDILLKTFSEHELLTLRASLQPGSRVEVCKAKHKSNVNYYILVHNTLPCWISDQINKVMHYNATDQCYKEWACTAELNAAKRISKKMQEDIVQKAVEYLGVASCAKDDFCHTFTNILKESHVPRNIKKKCATFANGCVFSDDWEKGCLVKISSDWQKGVLHLKGPDNGTRMGTGWQNKYGNLIPGCLYASKKSFELLKTVQWDPAWGFQFLEIL
jgi:hypothetical protein